MPCSQASSFVYAEQEHQLQLQLLLPHLHQVTGCSGALEQSMPSWSGLLAPTASMLCFTWQDTRACGCSQLPQPAPCLIETCMPSQYWHSGKVICQLASWPCQGSCPGMFSCNAELRPCLR